MIKMVFAFFSLCLSAPLYATAPNIDQINTDPSKAAPLKSEQSNVNSLSADLARGQIKLKALEPDLIDDCFTDNSEYLLCLYQDKNDFGWHFVDRALKEPYQPYYFDSGPDYPKDDRYRVRIGAKIGYANAITGELIIPAIYDCAHPFVDGKAQVGFGCTIETDGEHSWWVNGRWQDIDTNGHIIDR